MNAIDNYIQLKDQFRRFLDWRKLIGKEYFGGTRGRGGEYGKVVSASGNLTIYYQHSDGDTNYHELERGFHAEFGMVMLEQSQLLLDKLQARLSANLESARVEAEKLAKTLLPAPDATP